ncbi:adenine phosphoribosyltransferase [Planctomycetia bacterium]|jgi:adenine phosphoribosyltransferase|nr:adenine phosphoribosyltransferase [Planctomycetia bacterium]
MDLARHIRPIPDFPKPGILFRDITPLLADVAAFAAAIDRLAEPWRGARLDAIAAVEARGFLFAGPLALELNAGLIPVRKPGKLPAETISYEYDLEYGRDRLEMHTGILQPGARVLVVDDVLATGGTAAACMRLVEAAGGTVAGGAFLVEIEALGGRDRLAPQRVETVLRY